MLLVYNTETVSKSSWGNQVSLIPYSDYSNYISGLYGIHEISLLEKTNCNLFIYLTTCKHTEWYISFSASWDTNTERNPLRHTCVDSDQNEASESIWG